MEMIVHSVDDLDRVVEALQGYAGDRKVLLFYGEIGAGKTTLIQHFCKSFDVAQKVNSPTFSLINEYSYNVNSDNQECLIHHLDLYRLNNIEESIDIGFEDSVFADSYCLI